MRTKKEKFGKVAVRFVEDWQVVNEGGATTIFPEYGSKDITRSHTKRYHNCLYLLAGLSSCARDVMDFVTEQMDEQNMISTNSYLRGKFREFIAKTTGGRVDYCDSSVKKAIRVLVEKGLIIPVKRGYSRVNPSYFWKNDETGRLQSIRLELEFEAGADTKLRVLQKEYGVDAVVKR